MFHDLMRLLEESPPAPILSVQSNERRSLIEVRFDRSADMTVCVPWLMEKYRQWTGHCGPLDIQQEMFRAEVTISKPRQRVA